MTKQLKKCPNPFFVCGLFQMYGKIARKIYESKTLLDFSHLTGACRMHPEFVDFLQYFGTHLAFDLAVDLLAHPLSGLGKSKPGNRPKVEPPKSA